MHYISYLLLPFYKQSNLHQSGKHKEIEVIIFIAPQTIPKVGFSPVVERTGHPSPQAPFPFRKSPLTCASLLMPGADRDSKG